MRSPHLSSFLFFFRFAKKRKEGDGSAPRHHPAIFALLPTRRMAMAKKSRITFKTPPPPKRVEHLNGFPVYDSTESILFQAIQVDYDRAIKEKKRTGKSCNGACVFSQATERTTGRPTLTSLSRIYIFFEDHYKRYRTSQTKLRPQLILFDTEEKFELGEYMAIKMQPSRKGDPSRDDGTRKKF